MKTLSIILIAFFLLAFFNACEKYITSECATYQEVEPRLSSIQKLIFNPSCVGCHSGAAAQGSLDLSPGKAYANLVNAKSTASTLKRVVPGNSSQSYLMKRLTGSNGETIMPPGGILPRSSIEAIRQWIESGAKND